MIKSKKGFMFDQVFDILLLALGLLVVAIILSVVFSDGVEKIRVEYKYQENIDLNGEKLLIFLNSKVDNIETYTPNIVKLTGYLSQNHQKPVELKIKNKEYEYAYLYVEPVNRSDIFLLAGTDDDISKLLKNISIVPKIGESNQLSSDVEKAFIGCSDNYTGDITYLKNWVNNGGTLILTHDSYNISNKLVGYNILESDIYFDTDKRLNVNFDNIAKDELGLDGLQTVRVYRNLKFTKDYLDGNLAYAGKIKQIGFYTSDNSKYFTDRILEIDFANRDSIGSFGYVFEEGNGKIIVFSGHLSNNEFILQNQNFVSKVLGSGTFDEVKQLDIDLGNDGRVDTNRISVYEPIKIDFTQNLNEEIRACNQIDCDYKISMTVDTGILNLKSVEYRESIEYVKGNYYTNLDLLLDMIRDNKKSEICPYFSNFFATLDQSYGYKVSLVRSTKNTNLPISFVYETCSTDNFDTIAGYGLKGGTFVVFEPEFIVRNVNDSVKLVFEQTKTNRKN